MLVREYGIPYVNHTQRREKNANDYHLAMGGGVGGNKVM